MSVERPDWTGGTDIVPMNGAAVSPYVDGQAIVADVEARWNGRQPGDALPVSPRLVAEMSKAADGLEANLSALVESANGLLDGVQDREGFVAHFDTLSPGLQGKALRELWRNPGASFLDLLDRVEPTLTLAEQHEAEIWIRELKRRGLA